MEKLGFGLRGLVFLGGGFFTDWRSVSLEKMKKVVVIEKGKNRIQLKWNGSLSSLQFDGPLSLHWFDYMGSLGKFYVLLPYNEEYRNQIQVKISESLNCGNELIEEDLSFLDEILSLFENSKYEISYEPEYRFEINDKWNWELAFNRKKSTTDLEIFKKQKDIITDEINNIYSVTETFYDGNNETFLFTQPKEVLSNSRINHYENQINKGFKPTAIIYYGILEQSGIYDDGSRWKSTERSGLYILDGHHKLVAYKNLNQAPSLIRIVKRYNSKEEFNLSRIDFDEEIKLNLYNPQIKHINENCKLKNGT